MGAVLVVDDDDDIREEIRAALVFEGYDVATAHDGEDALRVLNGMAPAPCVVLLDMMMPRLTGNEVLEAMALHPTLARVPVVVVSAYPGRVHGGARQVLAKPFKLNALLTVVAGYCTSPPR